MRTRRINRSTALLAAGAAAAALGVGIAAPASAAAQTATTKPAITHECFVHDVYTITGNGVNIHQYHYTGSRGGVIFGLGYRGQLFASTQTATIADDGYQWVYGTDESTGVSGWMVTAYLRFDYNDGTCLN